MHLADARQSFVRSYCDAFHVEGPGALTITRMIRFKPRGTLHLHLQMESPLIEKDFAELGAANNSLDYYFAELRTTILDSYTSALYRVPGKKIEVEQMCMRIRDLLKDKDGQKPLQADLVAISLCKDDIELLNKSLQDMVNNNIFF